MNTNDNTKLSGESDRVCDSEPPEISVDSAEYQQEDSQWVDLEEEEQGSRYMRRPPNFKLSFVRILQHFYVMGNITLTAMTSFLKLLHQFTPYIDYNKLPRTARTLVKIPKKQSERILSREIPIKGSDKVGEYVHFGLKDAICGDSPGKFTCNFSF